ncbi:hypothetical protein [Glaciimonas immobilis]|uniref:Uncharacterized protein n=1 Tax=Glaciimonas immobilis TaxID=728004 RepID=A0A840RPS1_9BURK|nr:hypothetical protein [Glaciimonas immobilis]KAF3999068.1 hypothetical protein HAV38_03745 [Glaciimonas immobilis]MBB5198499.1 hypothetical protein [Glaciimonas immobilis]
MAYIKGVANTMEALRAAICTLCVANGWLLHKGEAVLSKNGVFFSLVADTKSVPQSLAIRGGTGVDQHDALTGQAGNYAAMRRVGYAASDPVFPLTYEIYLFNDPDEVYVVINYNVDSYQYLAFGKSNVQSLPASATGGWFSASAATKVYNGNREVSMHASAQGRVFAQCPGLFWIEEGFQVPLDPEPDEDNYGNSFIHSDLEGRGWSGPFYHINTASGSAGVRCLLRLLPNTWNDETVLLPYPIYQPFKEENKVVLVADLVNIRHVRIDNHAPGDIITLGADRWKVYPWMKKVITSRNGASSDYDGAQGTGTLGYAIRYTGS